MKENIYLDLIQKKLDGALSLSETTQLETWLNKDVSNAEYFQSLKDQYEASKKYSPQIEIDVKKDFQKLKSRIESSENKHQKSTGKLVPLKSSMNFIMGIAASILLVVTAFWLSNQSNIADTIEHRTASNETRTVTLPDGSSIWLNENSFISFPETFDKPTREVKLQGEAFFEITKNPNAPFTIDMDNSKVTVLGTSFNIKESKGKTIVSVRTGKVKFQSTQGNTSSLLTKGEKAVFRYETNTIDTQAIGGTDFTWKTGVIKYNNANFDEVIKSLEKHFDVQIIMDSKLQNCSFTGLFDNKKLVEILNQMAEVYNFELIENTISNYQLKGGQCQ